MYKKLTSNLKRIKNCKKIGSISKLNGHKKELFFNNKYGNNSIKLTYKPEADCKISKNNTILKELIHLNIIKNENQNLTSNKSGKNIQIVLGKIKELDVENKLELLENKKKFSQLLNIYFKKCESENPVNLLVYDTGKSHIFFNMDHVINYMVKFCIFRKLKSGRIKGDFIDNSYKGKRQYFTYEYRKSHKSHFIGFNGNKGKQFIYLIKDNLKYLEKNY